ncbi:MAG: hypothetical protein KKA07_00295 [Bacteroidetes bacterium]|nr:hypothetical protein [Bacteroidota bacterium]MBU1717490.1 hypothetical protein [Bacteroidota bacterium]
MEAIRELFAVVTAPGKGWAGVVASDVSGKALFFGYVVPFSLLCAVSAWFGIMYFPSAELGAGIDPYLLAMQMMYSFLIPLLNLYVAAWVISRFVRSLKGEINYGNALRLTAYSYFPVFLGIIISNLHPDLKYLMAMGFAGIFYFAKGARLLTPVHARFRTGYVISSAMIVLGTGLLISLLFTGLLAAAVVIMW